MRLGAERRRDDEGDEHEVVPAEHRPRGEQHDHPGDQGEIRVPRLGQGHLPVAADDDGQQRPNGRHAPPSGAAMADPEGGGDGREMDRDRAGLQRPRRRPEQAVDGGEQVEAERAGVTALVGVLTDPPGQADQGRVRGADVADAELGHRQVEDRVPALAAQRDRGDDERQTDHDDGDRNDPAWAPAAAARRQLCCGHDRRSVVAGPAALPAPSMAVVVTVARLASAARGVERGGDRGGDLDPDAIRPRRPHLVRARRIRGAAATRRGCDRYVGGHRRRPRAGGDPPARALPLHRRDDGRGLHALLPGADEQGRRAQRRLPAPLRTGLAARPALVVRDLRLLAARRADVRAAATPRHHLRAVHARPGVGPGGGDVRRRARRVLRPHPDRA